MAPVPRLPEAHAVLVNPGVPLATADVFRALEAPPLDAARIRDDAPPTFTSLSQLGDFMRARGNDLERPAVRLLPVVGEVKRALEAEPGCLIAAMTGSGPTCFGIFTERSAAKRAADRLAEAHAGWWVRPAMLQGA